MKLKNILLTTIFFLIAAVVWQHVEAATVTYTYDNLSRIIKVDYGDGTVINYTYDAAGNRLTTAQVVPSDLIISSLTGPPSASTGAPVTVSNTVKNQGTGSAASSTLKFYLSTDATINASDIYLGQRSIGALAAGATSSVNTNLTIPVTTAPGSYYIGAIADTANTNIESDETNNTTSAVVTVTSGVDLVVSSLTGPPSASTGTPVSVSNTVKNQGTGSSASSTLKFYLSADATIDAADIYLGQRSVGSLGAGATSSANTNITIPVSVAPGSYYIGAIADTANTNIESDETNNTGATSAVNVTSGVDLVVNALAGPSNAATGTIIPVANTVKNQGTGSAASSTLKFYLSADATIDAADIYLGQRSVGSLAGGATSSVNTNVTIPVTTAAGSYYIGAIADTANTNVESDETNNTASTAITVTSGVDLVVSSMTPPPTAATGAVIVVPNTVRNQGTGSSASSTLKFYLSTDATIDATDIYLGQRSVGALAAGATSSVSTNLTIPVTTAPGGYYIGAIADTANTNIESDETNNTFSAAVNVTSGVDLIVSALAGPSNAATGTIVPVLNTVKNQGAGSSASSTLKFYLSTDATIDAADIYLGQRSVGALAAGATSSANTNLTIPVTMAPGSYYIGAIADTANTNIEINETNNTGATSAVNVTSGVDLIVSALAGPSNAATGTIITVANTVRNQGTGSAVSSTLKFYLSADATIEATDIYLGQRSVGALAAGATSSANTNLTIPVATTPGSYYIGAIADTANTNVESDETNNTASTAVTVTSGVDLVVSSLTVPSSAATGTIVPVSNAVKNQGTGSSASSTLRFYLSTDATIAATDLYLGQRSVGVLAAGATSSVNTNLTIPVTTAAGSYYIGAIADTTNTNIESDETNNTQASAVTVTSGVDLVVSSMTPPPTAATGAVIVVPNTVRNQGTGIASSSTLKFYLSADATIDATDIYLGQRSAGSLGAGATSSANTNITIPVSVAPGSYYIGAIADTANTNIENDETNNTTSAAVTVTSGVDLVVSSMTPPPTAATGAVIVVPNTVRNQGTGSAASSTLKFYLSTDATIDATDIYLGQRSVGALAAGATSSANTNLTIPVTTAPGSYYIGAIADTANTNVENDETNNTFSAAVTVTSGVDLIVSALTGPSSAATGTIVPVSNAVRNQGTGSSASSTLRFYLSTDATIDATDLYLGQRSVGTLAAGATNSANTNLTIPVTTAPGSYYIGAIADTANTNVESDETNNSSAAFAIAVSL